MSSPIYLEINSTILTIKVKCGEFVSPGSLLLTHKCENTEITRKLKSEKFGNVNEIYFKSGANVKAGEKILEINDCVHDTVMKDMCAMCGQDLKNMKKEEKNKISMVHSIPELVISEKHARQLGLKDEQRLLSQKRLSLIVDLDQTILHTTNKPIPNNILGVHHYKLYGCENNWYHTRFRPHTLEFLRRISIRYELHICTFGSRSYAHTVSSIIDKDKTLFSHRILSRDECFSNVTKSANLKSLFPIGDSMTCIIDDRDDVWNFASNLIQVKPYSFFKGTGDINSPGKEDNSNTENCDQIKAIKTIRVENQVILNTRGDENLMDCSLKSVTYKETEKVNLADDLNIDSSDSDSGDDFIDSKHDKAKASGNLSIESKDKKESILITKDNDDKHNVTKDNKDEKDNEDKDDKVDTTNIILLNQITKKPTMKIGGGGDNSNENVTRPEKSVEYTEMVIWPDDDDHYLLHLEAILERVHQFYYALKSGQCKDECPTDVNKIVPYLKKKTLKGVSIVFSSVFPLKSSSAEQYASIAKDLGATITTDLEEGVTTHLIGRLFGTTKYQKAKRNKSIKIVSIKWLWCCLQRWEHVDESLFTLDKEEDLIEFPLLYSKRQPEPIEPIIIVEPPPAKKLCTISHDELLSLEEEIDDDSSIDSSSDENEDEIRRKVLNMYKNNKESSEDESLDTDKPKGWKEDVNSDESDDILAAELERELTQLE